MGIFSKGKKTQEISPSEASARAKQGETAAAIAAALELYSAGRGRITARRQYYSPWRDQKRAAAMERM